RLAEQCRAQIDERISAENKGIRKLFGDGTGLSISVDLGNLPSGQLLTVRLRRIARQSLEGHAQSLQQLRASWRSGSKNDRRQVHRASRAGCKTSGRTPGAESPRSKACRNADSFRSNSASDKTGPALVVSRSRSTSIQDLHPP